MILYSNELIARIIGEDINARSFLISTNLAYGTVRLYKAQVDKLYGKIFINSINYCDFDDFIPSQIKQNLLCSHAPQLSITWIGNMVDK